MKNYNIKKTTFSFHTDWKCSCYLAWTIKVLQIQLFILDEIMMFFKKNEILNWNEIL